MVAAYLDRDAAVAVSISAIVGGKTRRQAAEIVFLDRIVAVAADTNQGVTVSAQAVRLPVDITYDVCFFAALLAA